MLAQRTSLFSSSGTAAARAAAKAAAAAGKEIFDLTAGEIWTDLAPSLRAGARDAIDRGINRYSETVGIEALRQAIARRLSVETGQLWGPEEIAVTTGAKQALFNAAMLLLNPGDEVIIPAPYWSTFPAQVSIAGGRPVFLDTRANGYVPDLDALAEATTPRTRAIVVNTPNNPSGTVYDRATLAGIAELAIERDLWIVFDECYGTFAHAPWVHQSIVAMVPEVRSRTIVVNAFSKELGITGWRLGYLAGPGEVVKVAKALQSHTTSNPNVIAQHAVLAHLENSDGTFEQQLRARLGLARTKGLSILSSLAHVPIPAAQGGFYFYLDLAEILTDGQSADDVVSFLLAEAGVAGVAGTTFGDRCGLRLSYGVPLAVLERGLRSVVKALNTWSGSTPRVESAS